MQTLAQAVAAIHSGRIRGGLAGLPKGGWGDTQQAIRRLEEELPLRRDREYTLAELIEAAYEVDHAQRYQLRKSGEL